MIPFLYPKKRHVRRHGPAGYASYRSYRPWLRDEFDFRCVYCLKREQWGIVRGTYDIEHFIPQILDSKAVLKYDNLLYSCASCNAAKSDKLIPNPCDCMVGGQVVVHENGRIQAMSKDAAKLIRVLGLDDPEYREFRMLWIGIVQMARSNAPELYRKIMKYPDNVPNLALLRPPFNSRPEGVENSYWRR